MKKKHTVHSTPSRQPAREGFRGSLGQGGFFNLRALTALLLCAAAAFSMIAGTLLAFFRPPAQPASFERTLTFAERVAYQRAIEEVYWGHRLWPKENSKPKRSLDEVMSAPQTERKVEDYLRDAQTVEDYWQRPITPDQLQAEMERIASHTKQPRVLRELFAALGNDPFVIAECLARPMLAKQLMTNLYAHDQRLQSELRQRTKSWQGTTETRTPNVMATARARYNLPTISGGSGCTDNSWTATSVTNAPAARSSHTAVWTGSEMIVWGGYGGSYFNTGGRYDPSTDSWATISTMNAPTPRGGNTAVWTGSEMIVWGGDDGFSLNTGGRYNPATDTWTATNTTTAPLGRIFHTAVWDGSEMIVWGGWNEIELRTGGRYNPGTDSWTATSTTNAPTARYEHTAVLTGNEMIVWGGRNAGNYFNTGGKYNPSTDSWAATSTTDAPVARFSHTAVSNGSDMIVWGGTNMQKQFNTGGRYNPGTDTWMATSTANAPEQRAYHTAVWSGSEMIVWGGLNDFGPFYLNTGGRYCAQSTPTPTPTATPTCLPSWVVVDSPNANEIQNDLNAVTGSGNDVWAVGEYDLFGLGEYRTLTIHWDSGAWSLIPSPNPGMAPGSAHGEGVPPNQAHDYLFGATGRGNDVWAVGAYNVAGGLLRTLTLHWNGSAWSQAPSPNAGTSE